MKILFINGSPNQKGNTANIAAHLLKKYDYDTLNIVDYRINVYGQQLDGDQFNVVLDAIQQADILVIGSPVYWHNICGSIRNVLDRFYGMVDEGSLTGKSVYFIFQGAAPEKWMLEAGEYTIRRFSRLYGMTYKGMATSRTEAERLSVSLAV